MPDTPEPMMAVLVVIIRWALVDWIATSAKSISLQLSISSLFIDVFYHTKYAKVDFSKMPFN